MPPSHLTSINNTTPTVLSSLVALVCAVGSLGTTCENQDFSDLEILTFNAPRDGSVFRKKIFQAYEARSVLDFRVKNGSDEPLRVVVRARPIRAGRTVDLSDVVEDAVEDADAAACFEDDPAACPDTGSSDVGNTDVGSGDASQDAVAADVVDLGDAELVGTQDECVPDPESESDRSLQGERRISLQGFGQWRAGRFGEDELQTGIGVEIEIEVLCESGESASTGCTASGLGEVEYTLLGKQYECQSSTECSSDQTCDESLGLCVGRACVQDGDCPNDQICNTDLCRCVDTGCFCATPTSAPRGVPWTLSLLVVLVGFLVVRRRERGRA